MEVTNEEFIEIKYIIKLAYRNLGLRDDHNISTILPFQPLLIHILNLTKSGCVAYSKLLRKKNNLNRNQTKSESKWHLELGCTFGVEFWNKTYSLTAGIKHENKLRWFQYQINRNSLFTNYRVNKFKNYISPLCTFCSHLTQPPHHPPHPEIISHLFFDCNFALQLWQEVRGWLASLNIGLELNRTKLLFGVQNECSLSIRNFVILTVKYYIWKTKFQNRPLSLYDYQHYLKSKLEDQKNAYVFEGEEFKFDPWLVIFNCLEQICTD